MAAVYRPKTAMGWAMGSKSSSVASSPSLKAFDSRSRCSSSTSISSIGSVDSLPPKIKSTPGVESQLFDAYGNEFQLPDFSIKDVRAAIPQHCFERSASTGFYYVARDVAGLAITFYLCHNYITEAVVPSPILRSALWAGYAFLQGLFATGLWVIAHECGHQAFSPSKTLNDTVGWFLHSFLLVPYFSWKITHGKHHKATGHLERDMVFVPWTRQEFASLVGRLVHEVHELTEDTPIATTLFLLYQQIFGWQTYLLTNITGNDHHGQQRDGKGAGKHNGVRDGVNHFNPGSPLFEKKDEHLILLSDLGLLLVGSILVILGRSFGGYNLFVWYFVPYFWCHHWLIMITYLQHTDPSLPHYTGNTWTFVRGAACTIDRNFWPIGPFFFHHVIETHVLHHYCSHIPFYHAVEASEAIKPVMGRHYRSDTRNGAWGFLYSIWRNARWCQWVEEDGNGEGEDKSGEVLFFKNRNGLGRPARKMAAPQ